MVITFPDKMATANKIEEQTFLNFACDHLLVEMVSTEKIYTDVSPTHSCVSIRKLIPKPIH